MAKIRILKQCAIQGVDYRANDVVELDDKLAAAAVKDGSADASAEGLEAAAEESDEVITHKAAEKASSRSAAASEKR